MKNHITQLLGILLLGLSQWGAGPSPATAQNLPSFPTVRETIAVDSSEFILKGLARNGDTGDNFDHIYLDVYKILPQGGVELIRADRFPGGKFEIWLRKNERYLLSMNYNNRAFLEGFLNPTDAQIIDGVLSQIFILDEYQPDEDQAPEVTPAKATPPVIISEAEILDSMARVDSNSPSEIREPQEEPAAEIVEQADLSEQNLSAEETAEINPPLTGEEPASPDTMTTEIPGTYYVYESTSFRAEATHLSGILLRFGAGDQVELLEKTNEYWWKVRFKGKTGWVKAAKLQQDWF